MLALTVRECKSVGGSSVAASWAPTRSSRSVSGTQPRRRASRVVSAHVTAGSSPAAGSTSTSIGPPTAPTTAESTLAEEHRTAGAEVDRGDVGVRGEIGEGPGHLAHVDEIAAPLERAEHTGRRTLERGAQPAADGHVGALARPGDGEWPHHGHEPTAGRGAGCTSAPPAPWSGRGRPWGGAGRPRATGRRGRRAGRPRRRPRTPTSRTAACGAA